MKKRQYEKIKLAVLDMDGTLTKPISSWEHIHRELGTWEGAGEMYLKQFLAGTISYQEFARLDTASWRGVPLNKIRTIASKIPYISGIHQFMKYLSKRDIVSVIISGGLSVIAEKIVSDFDIKEFFANDLIVESGLLTGEVTINVSFHGKLDVLNKLLLNYNIKNEEVMTVGDTFGDVPLFENSGLAIVINPINPQVSNYAHYTINSLDQIIPILES